MRRFIISFWFIALSAAACALILPGRALARPADVSVNVGIKPWWSNVAQPLSNVNINIRQVDEPNVFPIQDAPYNTNHLVSNANTTAPTAKSYDINTSNGFMQNLPWLGGTFRSITFANFAWCGTGYYERGTPPYYFNQFPEGGRFKMDFTVTPTAPPSPYGGYWSYLWSWDTAVLGLVNGSGNSNIARAPANNDNRTTVGFTFIENPPPKGSITISKYEGKKEQNPPLANSSAVKGIQADISNKPSIDNGSTWWRIPASWNRYTVPGVLVENSDYRLSFSVPTGYKLGNTSGLLRGTVCSGPELTGNCTNDSVRVNQNADTAIGLYFERIEYKGNIQINKRDAAGNISAASTVPGNSSVGINNGSNGNGPSWNPNGTSNPFSTSGVYVNPGDVYSNEQRPGSAGSYNSYIDIPSGYRLNRFALSLSAGKPAITGANDTPKLTCDKPDNTGRCTVSGVRVASNDTSYVDFFIERAIKGNIQCSVVQSADGKTRYFEFNGTAYDGTNPKASTEPPKIRFDFKYPDELDQTPDELDQTILAKSPGSSFSDPYRFSLRMDNRLHDNKPHELRAYMKLANGTEEQLNIGAPNTIVFGPDTPCNGTQPIIIDPNLCPQGTKLAGLPKPADGNCNPTPPELCPAGSKLIGQPVPANKDCNPASVCPPGTQDAGKPIPANNDCDPTKEVCPAGTKLAGLVIMVNETCDPTPPGPICPSFPGQDCRVEPYFYPWLQTKGGDVVSNGKINGQISGDSYLGSSKSAPTDKEAEFLVVAAVGGGGPFCSTYNYILTNTNAAVVKDSCSNGAGYSILNTYSLTTGADDNAVIGANKAYNELEPACKGSGLPSNPIVSNRASCPKGSMYKLPAGSIGNITIGIGQVTIVVDGDLTINGNISYANASVTDPRDLPSLAIVAKGNITIDPGVKEINALIYSAGSLNTCGAEAKLCNKQLKINGSLVAKAGFKFARTYTSSGPNRQNDPDASRDAAEIITLTPQTIAFPPPGIDISYFSVQASSVNLDSAEYNPRF